MTPTLRRRLAAVLALTAIAPGARAIEPAAVHWDLSYKTALAAYPIGADEVLNDWLAQHPVRPSQARLAAYQGPPIEGSFLLEKPDSHVGDPQALWIIRTHDAAQACSFHPKIADEPCTPLDPARTDAFLRQVLAMKPDLKAVSPANVIDHDGPGQRPRLLNYYAFISVFVDGRSVQRALPVAELVPIATPEDPGAGQLQNALDRLFLDDKALAARDVALRGERRRLAADTAAESGDAQALARALDEPGTAPLDLVALLATAAGHHRVAAVDLLLARGADVDAQQSAALRAATEVGDLAMATHLLERGAKADPPPSSIGPHERLYESALGVAARNGNATIAKLLVEHGANPRAATTQPIVWLAASSRDLATLEVVLRAGAVANVLSWDSGRTPLMELAAGHARKGPGTASTEALFRRLLAAGADINFTTPTCATAWDEASHAIDKSEALPLPLLESLGADPRRTADCRASTRRIKP